MGKEISVKYEIKHTPRALKKIYKLYKEETILARIFDAIDDLEAGNDETITIRMIKRNGKLKISEVKIKNPKEYRIFFTKLENEKIIWILDIIPKKKNAFSSKYFDELDKIKLY
jgi:mRNA-degrading endonuclease RelE of RelBE toxin-antitoxin system